MGLPGLFAGAFLISGLPAIGGAPGAGIAVRSSERLTLQSISCSISCPPFSVVMDRVMNEVSMHVVGNAAAGEREVCRVDVACTRVRLVLDLKV